MAKEVSVNSIPDKHADWGIDTRNGLPYSGQAVQNYIKKELEGKAGIFYYDNSNNRYLVFSDSENKDIYLSDPTKTDLIIATFDAPFNYTAEIHLTTPSYNAIFVGDTGNYIDFTFDIKNKQGASTGESVIVKYTFTRGASKQEVSEIRAFGSSVHFNIDKYLAEGTNTIIVSVTGQTTLAATTVAITYEVVNLQLTDSLDISKVYNLTNGVATLDVPYSISGYGTKIVEWYIDGEQLDYVRAEDEIVESNTTRTKHITLSNLAQGRHSLQFRAYTTVSGIKYYTHTLYRDIIVYTGVSNDVIIAIAVNIPSQYGVLGVGEDVAIYDMVQYAPYSLRFATYTATNVAETEVAVMLGNDTVARVLSSNGIENNVVIYPSESGSNVVRVIAGDVEYDLVANILPTKMDIGEITNGLTLNLTASGKSNRAPDRDTWTFGNYVGTLTGFVWNDTSGWVNNRLEMNAGSSVDINYAPLGNNPTNLGKTIEIEWATKNVHDDNAIICDMRTNGVGIVIYATKVAMTSADGVTIETEYKSDENVRISFVINPNSGATHQRMSFIYANGVLSRAEKWAITDNYTSPTNLHFTASEGAEVSIKSIRIYDDALSSDNILNNYILYRDSIQEMLEVYDRNDVYEEGRDIFDAMKMASRLPVMIVTGDIPTLENTSDKDTQIVVDIDYTNLQDPTKSFRMVNAAMRPQGTSSMGYPKKNFRIYTQKLEETILYDANGNVVEDKLYSFKEGAQPVNCWCLKADYAESSGTHNTGIARLWNKALYDARVTIDLGKDNPHNVDNEPLLRTNAQKAAIEAGYPYDVRTTIDGFPILLFYRPSATDDLIFIGKYNFNNDKSTESVFGFKGIPNFDNSRMQCWEVLNNGNALALFTTTENFDTKWSDAFESRYPDTKTPNTADLKSFANWMVNVSIENFAIQKWEHLDVYKMAAYWVYLMRHAAADQFVKNAMFTSEDGKHFYYILYDNDTINGLINTGHLEIRPTDDRRTVDASGEPVFAGRDSRLWNMLEADDEFMRIVSQVDNALYSAGISYANTIRIFDDEQADKWVEKVYNQDAMYKYVSPYVDKGINNLFMLQGKRDLHRRWWLANRFAIYDAKYVSGEYKSQAIELKCINNTPSGQQFTVTSGYPIDYGFGINNIPREYGVSLNIGESHTFTTSEVVNLGDPIRIYGASNIAELDLSPMASRLATITIANVYNEAKGTKLTKLVVGASDVNNYEVAEISGLRQALALEYLDIQGMRNMTSVDLTEQLYFKTLKAHNTNISSVQFAKGAPVSLLELPASMRVLSLEQLPLLSSENIFMENLANVSIITIKDCPNVSNDFNFIYAWVTANSERVGDLTLDMNRVDWSGVSGEQLAEIARIGNISLTGKVELTDITVEQGDLFTSVWGDTIYDENAEFFIDAPVTVTVSGASSVLEGATTQFTASIFPSVNGHFEWSLPTQVVGLSINRETGVLATTERGLDNYDVVVRATFIFDNGDAPVSGDASIEIVKRTYPEGVSISGNGELTENTSFTWSYSNSGVNGYYDEIWSLEGDIANYYEVHYSQGVCVLNKTNAPADTVSGRLRLDIERNFDGAIMNSAYIEITHTVVWMQDATIIGNTNPLEQPMEYTWETTTEGVNGDYYAEWSLEGDVTSVVKIKTQTNTKCTLEVLNVVTEVVVGTITLKLRKQYDNSIIITATKTLAAVMEGVVITSATNPGVQAALYDAGLVANESYSLRDEVEKITAEDLRINGTSIFKKYFSQIITFDEFEYFIGVNSVPNSLFYQSKLESIILPNSIKEIGTHAFSYSKLKKVNIPEGVTNIYSYAFCETPIETLTIPDSMTTIGDYAFENCIYLRETIVGKGITTIGSSAFGYCTGELIVYCNIPNTNSTSSNFYRANFSKVSIMEGVVSIGAFAFIRCINLTSVTIPNSVTEIGGFAFSGCSSLKDITIPESVTEIGDGAFESCINLKTINIPQGITKLPNHIFNYCGKLTNITIPSNVTEIGAFAFGSCLSLSTIHCRPLKAPTTNSSTFGDSNGSYTGYNTQLSNTLFVKRGATGYDADAWLDPLQNIEKCSFSIYGKFTVEANKASKYTILYTTLEDAIKTLSLTNGTHYLDDIKYGTTITITVTEGGTPDEGVTQTIVYDNNSNSVTFTFPREGSWITIDQTITDPSAMISGDINGEHIQAIRNNSHRYLGKYTADGQMTICQLDDANSSLYVGGASANLYGTEGDVFMRLPRFWYDSIEKSKDVWTIGFYYGETPPEDSGWKEWDGNDLIGVFKASRSYSSAPVKSVISSTIYKGETYDKQKTAVESRGNGYSLGKWKHHCIMAFLFYAMYGNTNSQAILGAGVNRDNFRRTGSSASVGMQDTVEGVYNGKFVNFWGLEDWWGLYDERIGNVNLNEGKWTITEDDGTIRSIQGIADLGYASIMYIGSHLDMISMSIGGSATSGYCDRIDTQYTNMVMNRSGYDDGEIVGISRVASAGTALSYAYESCRLAFRGTIIEETDSAVFKSLTAIN